MTIEAVLQGFGERGIHANFTEGDKFGKSPLDVAANEGQAFMFEYLESIARRHVCAFLPRCSLWYRRTKRHKYSHRT
eukprot:766544-Hanusia_phi.AAC.10